MLTDITYIRFQDGFLYLSTILDAYTKEALAHVLSESLEVDFVLETVQIMHRDYGVSLREETLIHSDQGCHYTSIKFITLVQDLGLRQSMSRRGNCWDNAPQESFYGHMKDELMDKMGSWTSFADAKRDIDLKYVSYLDSIAIYPCTMLILLFPNPLRIAERRMTFLFRLGG